MMEAIKHTIVLRESQLRDIVRRYDICEDDSCYVIYQNENELKNPIYICPELHRALKDLPVLPLH